MYSHLLLDCMCMFCFNSLHAYTNNIFPIASRETWIRTCTWRFFSCSHASDISSSRMSANVYYNVCACVRACGWLHVCVCACANVLAMQCDMCAFILSSNVHTVVESTMSLFTNNRPDASRASNRQIAPRAHCIRPHTWGRIAFPIFTHTCSRFYKYTFRICHTEVLLFFLLTFRSRRDM